MTNEYEKLKPPSHRTSQTQLNMPGEHSQTNSLASLQIQSSGAQEENPEHKENVESRNCTDNKPRHLSHIAKIQAQVGAGNNRGSGLSFTHRLIAIVLAILMLISGPKCHYNYERLVKTLGDLRRGETVPLPQEFVPPLSHNKAFTDHPSKSHTNEDLIKTFEHNYDNIRLKDVINRTPNCSCVNSMSHKCKVHLNQTLLMVYDKPNERGVSLCTGKEKLTLMLTIRCGWNNCGSRKSGKKWTLLNVSRSNQRKQDTMGEPTAGVSESRSETFLSALLGMKCSCHLAEAGRVFSGGSIKRLPPPSKGRVPIDGKWHTKTSEKYYTNPKVGVLLSYKLSIPLFFMHFKCKLLHAESISVQHERQQTLTGLLNLFNYP